MDQLTLFQDFWAIKRNLINYLIYLLYSKTIILLIKWFLPILFLFRLLTIVSCIYIKNNNIINYLMMSFLIIKIILMSDIYIVFLIINIDFYNIIIDYHYIINITKLVRPIGM